MRSEINQLATKAQEYASIHLGKFYELSGKPHYHMPWLSYKIHQPNSDRWFKVFAKGSAITNLVLVLFVDTSHLVAGSTATVTIENTQSIHFDKLIKDYYLIVTMDGNQPKIAWRKK